MCIATQAQGGEASQSEHMYLSEMAYWVIPLPFRDVLGPYAFVLTRSISPSDD